MSFQEELFLFSLIQFMLARILYVFSKLTIYLMQMLFSLGCSRGKFVVDIQSVGI